MKQLEYAQLQSCLSAKLSEAAGLPGGEEEDAIEELLMDKWELISMYISGIHFYVRGDGR